MNGKATLLFVRGLPGSGKSYLSNELERVIGVDAAIKLDPDATDYSSKEYLEASAAMKLQGTDEKLHPYRFLRAQAYDGIEANKTIIWNQAFTNLETFKKVVANLSAFAEDKKIQLRIIVVEVLVDPDTARARIAARAQNGGHDVPSERFDKFVQDYHSFAGQAELDVIEVNGLGSIKDATKVVLHSLS